MTTDRQALIDKCNAILATGGFGPSSHGIASTDACEIARALKELLSGSGVGDGMSDDTRDFLENVMRPASSPSTTHQPEPPTICLGCGSMRSLEALKAGGFLSCCPERKTVSLDQAKEKIWDLQARIATHQPALPTKEQLAHIMWQYRDSIASGNGIVAVDAILELLRRLRGDQP